MTPEKEKITKEPQAPAFTAPVRPQATEATIYSDALADALKKTQVTDCRAPDEMARNAEGVGVKKAERDTISTIMLAILAGAFIGLGAMFMTVVTTQSGLSFGLNKLVGGMVFCLGLILVVIAGAELFTGNVLLTIGWLSGKIKTTAVARNWILVYGGNLAGGLALAGLMYYTDQWALNKDLLGANAVGIANAKVNLTFGTALARGIMCNALVCLAIWLCFSARTLTDKVLAIVFPITAFVAAGFEHSIANMYFIPMGIFLSHHSEILTGSLTPAVVANLDWHHFFVHNLIPVTIGNIIGGGIMVGAVYWMIYLRKERTKDLVAAQPWLGVAVPVLRPPKPIELETTPATARRTLQDVLGRAATDSKFLAQLAENPRQALAGYNLTSEEIAALSSGDIRWLEAKLGPLDERLKTWLMARQTQEKW